MAAEPRVLLLEADPELGRLLDEEDEEEAARVRIPVRHLRRGERGVWYVPLQDDGAFAAIVLDGMLLQRLRVGVHEALRLLGPGDLFVLAPFALPELLETTELEVAADTRLAILGEALLPAIGRLPRLAAAITARHAEQSTRLAAQLAICQLPRVSDRLLGILWLLAESWGRVTPTGVSLPLSLTHDALGGLIGARRSTVTLALGELLERSAIVRQDRGWLLLERLEPAAREGAGARAPEILDDAASAWTDETAHVELARVTHQELMASVDRLRKQLATSRQIVEANLSEVRSTRERVSRRREAWLK